MLRRTLLFLYYEIPSRNTRFRSKGYKIGLVPNAIFSQRNTKFYYRGGNTIIRPLIKRYPAAGHLCYCSGAFVLPRPVKHLGKAGARKGICGHLKRDSGPYEKSSAPTAYSHEIHTHNYQHDRNRFVPTQFRLSQ